MLKKAVIPAAGLGTRFLPATKVIPKEMIPILDVPMIQLIVEEAVRSGIEEIVLVTSRHKSLIENHFDHNLELEAALEARGKAEIAEISRSVARMCRMISVRQKEPLGLGHAVLCAEPVVGKEPFAVLLPDDLIDGAVPCTRQLVEVSHSRGGASVVGVMEVAPADVSKYGIVGGKSVSPKTWKVETLVEKPKPQAAPSRLAIPGRYVLGSEIFDHLRRVKPGAGGEIQLTDALATLAAEDGRGLYAFEFAGRRYDAGDRLGFVEATLAYALKRPDLAPGVRSIMQGLLE